VNPSGPGRFYVGRIFAASVSFLVIDLFEWFMSLGSILVDKMNLKTHPFVLNFSTYFRISVFKAFLSNLLDFVDLCCDTLFSISNFIYLGRSPPLG
jgi:hypothetical protein